MRALPLCRASATACLQLLKISKTQSIPCIAACGKTLAKDAIRGKSVASRDTEEESMRKRTMMIGQYLLMSRILSATSRTMASWPCLCFVKYSTVTNMLTSTQTSQRRTELPASVQGLRAERNRHCLHECAGVAGGGENSQEYGGSRNDHPTGYFGPIHYGSVITFGRVSVPSKAVISRCTIYRNLAPV